MTEIDLGVELDMSGSQMFMIVSRCKSSSKLQGKDASYPSWSKFEVEENFHWNEVGPNALGESETHLSETTSAAKKPPASNETEKSSRESAAPNIFNINMVRIVRSMRTCTC